MSGLKLSSLILGGTTFGEDLYNGAGCIAPEAVEAVIERALEHDITSIDTSPWYHPSEERIGAALQRLYTKSQGRWARDRITLLTKCGHYRPVDSPTEYDFSPSKVRESVHKSLERLQTTYLDVVYLHDVQGVADVVGDSHSAGRPADLIQVQNLSKNGLGPENDGKLYGEGDHKVLEALKVLFELKDAGLIKNVGISGYPLAVMLRVAIQVLHNLGRPLDILLSFCQHTLQAYDPVADKTNLELFAPLLKERGGVKQLVNASPLSMGLLTPRGPPAWHPAPKELRHVVKQVAHAVQPGSIANVALRFGLRDWKAPYVVPTITGWSTPAEVDASVAAKKASDLPDASLEAMERLAKDMFRQDAGGWAGWAWPAVWAP